MIDFGDSFSDKEVRSYVLELSSKYGTTPVRVQISTTSAPQGTEVIETLEGTETHVVLNSLKDENMIPLYVRAPYIRDEIIVDPAYVYDPTVYMDYGYVETRISTSRENVFYWEDRMPVVEDNPTKMVGRTFEVSGIDTRATAQTINQG